MGQPEWLEAARLGDTWALEQFYEAYRPLVHRLCARLLTRPEDVEDAMQAVFVSAFRHLPRFRGDSSLKTWMYRLTVNEAIRYRPGPRDPVALEEGHGSRGADAGTVVENVHVRDALRCIRPEHSLVLILRFWEGLSIEEIARVLGISQSAVKMRLHRARREFRSRYEEPE
jgi:RNA polymerase sigma-70 factor (ECF subfamily)